MEGAMRRFAVVGCSFVMLWAVLSLARWSAGALGDRVPARVVIDTAQSAAERLGTLETHDHLLRTRQEQLRTALDEMDAADRLNLLIATEEGPPEPGQSTEKRRLLNSELLQVERERQFVQSEWTALAATRAPRPRR
jgi:hypothetical protein